MPIQNKIFHLTSCSTCNKILGSLNLSSCELQDIKVYPITEKELDKMANMIGSYEALFSRRAVKFTSMGLKNKTLTEKQIRKLILSDYTFLKRPVMIIGNEIFAGNTMLAVNSARERLT